MPLQCSAEIQRLLLLRYDIQKKTYTQSPWTLNAGIFYYIYYDPRRERLFGLHDRNMSAYILEEYNTTTLDYVQKYTEQSMEQYGSACDGGCSVFDSVENWIVEVRVKSDGSFYHAYYVKMDLNLVGKKENIVTDFHELSKLGSPYTMTYDVKTKLVLTTWEHGTVLREIVMVYMNPYTSDFQNETSLLKIPLGWVVPSVQALFDESNRQVLFLIKLTDLQDIQITVWSITVDFDTMKIMEKKTS